jgi:alanyl-tRNA synthetase
MKINYTYDTYGMPVQIKEAVQDDSEVLIEWNMDDWHRNNRRHKTEIDIAFGIDDMPN